MDANAKVGIYSRGGDTFVTVNGHVLGTVARVTWTADPAGNKAVIEVVNLDEVSIELDGAQVQVAKVPG